MRWKKGAKGVVILWMFTHDTALCFTSSRFAKTFQLSPTIVVFY